MANLNWFLLRVMYVLSPLPLVAGLAFAVQGRFDVAALMFVVAAVLFAAGQRTRGQRTPPFR